jgi:hypothetical protein
MYLDIALGFFIFLSLTQRYIHVKLNSRVFRVLAINDVPQGGHQIATSIL